MIKNYGSPATSASDVDFLQRKSS